jgi:hypothetical protein
MGDSTVTCSKRVQTGPWVQRVHGAAVSNPQPEVESKSTLISHRTGNIEYLSILSAPHVRLRHTETPIVDPLDPFTTCKPICPATTDPA